MAGRLRIQPDLRWFPVGDSWQRAITQLSDGAFRLFAYACLNAEHTSGRLEFRQTELSRRLGKSRRSIAAYLQQLQEGGFCSVVPGQNQYGAGVIQIQPPYWPYESEPGAAQQPDSPQRDSYVSAIEDFLRSRACVSCRFSASDRELAEQWFQEGVELSHVEQAIILGCGRKYVSWLNGAPSPPIGSLRYFVQVLHEIMDANAPAEYYEFNKIQIRKIEQEWLAARPVGQELIQVPAQNFRRQNAETR